MVAYSDAVDRLDGPPRRSTSEAFADDVGFQKRFECLVAYSDLFFCDALEEILLPEAPL